MYFVFYASSSQLKIASYFVFISSHNHLLAWTKNVSLTANKVLVRRDGHEPSPERQHDSCLQASVGSVKLKIGRPAAQNKFGVAQLAEEIATIGPPLILLGMFNISQ